MTDISPRIMPLAAALPLRQPDLWVPILIVIIMGLAFGVCRRDPEIPDALLDVVSGRVEVFSGSELDLKVVSDDAEPSEGDRIRVLQDSQAAVVLFEGSVVLLDADADITVEELAGDPELGVSNIAIFQGIGRTARLGEAPDDVAADQFALASKLAGVVRRAALLDRVNGDFDSETGPLLNSIVGILVRVQRPIDRDPLQRNRLFRKPFVHASPRLASTRSIVRTESGQNPA